MILIYFVDERHNRWLDRFIVLIIKQRGVYYWSKILIYVKFYNFLQLYNQKGHIVCLLFEQKEDVIFIDYCDVIVKDRTAEPV